MERRVLAGLKETLVTPDLVAEFVEAYTIEWNRLQSGRLSQKHQRARELAEVNRRIKALIDAIEQGILTPSTKERLEALEADKVRLERAQSVEPHPMPALHPNLSAIYRDKVARLEVELNDPLIAAEAASVLRSLIEKIVVQPGEERGQVTLELHGELARIIAMTVGDKKQRGSVGEVDQVSVVAGVGFEPTTFRL